MNSTRELEFPELSELSSPSPSSQLSPTTTIAETFIPPRRSSILSQTSSNEEHGRQSMDSIRSRQSHLLAAVATTQDAFRQLILIEKTVDTIAANRLPSMLVKVVHDLIARVTGFISTSEDIAFNQNVHPDCLDPFLRCRTSIYCQASALTNAVGNYSENKGTVAAVLGEARHVHSSCVELLSALNSLCEMNERKPSISSMSTICEETESLLDESSECAKRSFESNTSVISKITLTNSVSESGDLVLDTKGAVKGGSVEALVEYLTSPDHIDGEFTRNFLMVYRGFTTSPDLVQHLIQRFKISPPKKFSIDELREWVSLKRDVVRQRVVDVLEKWVSIHFMPDDEQDREAITIVNIFIKNKMYDMDLILAHQLEVTISKNIHRSVTSSLSLNSVFLQHSVATGNSLSIHDINPMHLARELTLIEFDLFRKIRPIDILRKTLNSEHTWEGGKASTSFSNKVADWIILEILDKDSAEGRKVVIEKMISVAKACQYFGNFATVFSIVGALQSAPVHRLHQTWSLVDSQSLLALGELKAITASSKNFQTYRDALLASSDLCIPYLGLVMTDLIFIHDGNPDRLSGALINFSKYSKMSDVLSCVVEFQQRRPPFVRSAVLNRYLWSHMTKTSADAASLYNISLKCEPRVNNHGK
ncbi:ras guanine nucleotide exchange factor domain-containing protein [Obelidium mucronatum]|nr:ras guanine nucleotide exchange factor domain-containing protein [Obelidium mucronatum]